MSGAQDKRMSLEEAVARFVKDGGSVGLGGIAGREPMAVSYELIRQKKKNLTLITDTACDAADILIAGGCIGRVECAYIWIGVIGSGHNYRRAVENGVPNCLEISECSNMAMSMRMMAGALGLPFMPIKSLLGSDIVKHNPCVKVMEDPYGGGPVALVPAVHPDVAFIHVQHCDAMGNAQIWGMLGNDDNLARAARTVVITCEEVVSTSEIRKIPNMTAIPSYCVSAVVEAPFCCHPLPVSGYYWMDIPFRRQMVTASKTRETIVAWMDEWIHGVRNFEGYKKKVGSERLARVRQMELDNCRIPRFS
ncbi:MAG TPA: CoA-transferase [Thermodesulfobacteriota bacterium]|nr:CoA-transferase [Thermodesulfobacteriota bacterium]